MKKTRLVLLLVFSSLMVTAVAGTFTLDQILSAPFPSGMVRGPGDSVAWVMNEKGARNVWVAVAPDYRGRRLTSWDQDDGTTVSQLRFTPDGQNILFVRGDGPNRRGELPTPIHRPEGVEQAIWIAPLAGGEARKLTEGTSPVPLPDSQGTIFSRRGKPWQVSFEEGAKAEQLIKGRGSFRSLSWSPDGRRLAFVSNRGRHSFVGVYDPAAGAVEYLDPSVDRDGSPVWSPDSRQIAFIRIPAEQNLIFTPVRQAMPWSIRVVNVTDGIGREVFRASEGVGSAFRNVVASSQLFWSQDGYLVFPWERDGWTHLYSVPATGGSAELLTPGYFEVEYVSAGADGKTIVYNSNQDDIDRRHVWEVAASGGTPRRISRAGGNQWNPTPVSGGLAYIGGSGTSPAQPWIVMNGGSARSLAAGSLPTDFPEDQLVEPQQVVFSSTDGMKIHGQLFLPRDHQPGQRHPAMLYFHGGSRRQMLLGWHYSNYYHNCYALNQYMANQGYVVMSVNYRSGIGYGMEFREALNYGAAGASEFNDVMGAGLYLRGRDDVDGDRIGLWGGSYGGYLTALGLSRASDLFAAGVDVHGVHDWNKVIQGFVPSYDPKDYPEESRLAFESSPMASIDTWRSPVLLIHGDDDRNVPFNESVDLAAALRKRKVHVEQLVFPDEVHGFLRYDSWLTAFEKASDFLRRKLEGRGPE